jgi:hypothetical protein
MELKYNLMEGNDAVSRSILMMKYDLTKTLTENIISEQSVLTDYMIRHYMSQFYNWLKTFDTHDWLTVIEVSAMIAATVSGPFAPIFLGIGGAAAAYDSYLYFKDGDPYLGTIMAALSLIPGGIVKGIFKSSKVLQKRGVDGLINLIKKYKSGAKMTKEQLKDLATFGVEFAKKSSQVKGVMSKEFSKGLLASLSKKSPKFLANFLLGLTKLGLDLSKMVFSIGGTVYGFDQIYLYVFQDSVFKNKKYLDSRSQSRIGQLIDKLRPYDKEINKFLLEKSVEKLIDSKGKSIDGLKDTTEESSVYLDRWVKELSKKSNTKIPSNTSLTYSIAPTLDDVLSGKKVITKGQKGDSVKEIQKMLYSIGYDDFVARDENPNWNDGKYGISTELAVQAFQQDEDLNVNGTVDMKTLNKIMEKIK